MTIWAKILAALAIVGAIAGAGWHVRDLTADRDKLKQTATDEKAGREAAEKGLAKLQRDQVQAAKNADKLIQDRDAIGARLAAALSTAGRLHVIIPPDTPAPAPGASGAGDSAPRACGLSVADARGLEQRISRVESETYRIGADADRVVGKLAACQAEAERLQAPPE